uniref:Uncharacterized protein n=1 Tax=Anguilla anguilla TaxID=7936 RepID=A0A0E9QQU4_ANGAN
MGNILKWPVYSRESQLKHSSIARGLT